MSMVHCRGCAKEIHETAPTCPHCGCVQQSVATASPSKKIASDGPSIESPDKKFHITLIVSAFIGVVLLYSTNLIGLIGAATGVSFGLSVRLFMVHKKNDFAGTKKIEWIVITLFSTCALIFFLTSDYTVQGPLLIFIAVRTLILYFKNYSNGPETITNNKN